MFEVLNLGGDITENKNIITINYRISLFITLYLIVLRNNLPKINRIVTFYIMSYIKTYNDFLVMIVESYVF